MVALRSSLFLLITILSAACSATNNNFYFSYKTAGCFNLSDTSKEIIGETIFLIAKISHKKECGCKSALFKYRAYQSLDNIESELIQGYFTTLSRESLSLPVSAQKNSVYANNSIRVSFSCAAQ